MTDIRNAVEAPLPHEPDTERATSRNPDADGFNVVSLGAWIRLCEAVSLPCVPAEPVASIDIHLLMNWDVEQGPALRQFFTTIERAKRPHTMLRWDCCAPSDVKARMAVGRPAWSPTLTEHFRIDDPRAFTIMTEYPGNTMTVWRRPWMNAAVVDRYPVEYRVFVEAGAVIGISSYYPQRPLDQADTLQDIFRLNVMAGTLIRALDGKTIVHPPPDDRGPGGLSLHRRLHAPPRPPGCCSSRAAPPGVPARTRAAFEACGRLGRRRDLHRERRPGRPRKAPCAGRPAMTACRKPVFLNRDSYRRYARALERCKPPPAGHYPVGYAISSEGAQRALRRRFPGAARRSGPRRTAGMRRRLRLRHRRLAMTEPRRAPGPGRSPSREPCGPPILPPRRQT